MADNTALMTSIARLYYLDGMGQTEIAAIYGVSRSTVSRMLTAARERGIVRISVDEYDPRDGELERRLIERFGLKRAIVVRGVSGGWAANRRAVGHFAAKTVAEWLTHEKRIGVTGGRTLGELVRNLPRMTGTSGVEVVQLMGQVAGTPGQNEGSEIGRDLARRLNGSFYAINAPVFMPDRATLDAISAHDQIKSVTRLFPDVTLAFVGVGAVDDSMFVDNNVFSKEDLNDMREKGAVAEVCGRFVDSIGHEVDLRTNDRILSIDIHTLRMVDDVVAVTSGESRGSAVRAIFDGGIASGIITDDACARAVLKHS